MFKPHKLSQKLILSLTLILAAVGIIASYIHVRTQEAQLLDAMVLGADQLSGSITSATWHAMLDDHRAAAYEIMQTIATKQGINRIRIFNKDGRIMFSTARGDSGQVDKDAEACAICHSGTTPLVMIDAQSRARVYRGISGSRQLGMVTPIYNEEACSEAACHAHPASTSVLGVLDLTLDLQQVDTQLAGVRRDVFYIVAGLVVVMAVFIVLFTRHFVDRPIQRLMASTRDVSAMQLDRPVAVTSGGEVGELARSFESMRIRLRDALEENKAFTSRLESKVQERSDQLRVAHAKLLQSHRLASLGQLSASVAHEINNPISGVLNLSMLMQRILGPLGVPPERLEEFRKHLSVVTAETTRVGRIVQDLLAFSRRSRPHRSAVDLNGVVTATLSLIDYKLRLMDVAVDRHLGEGLPSLSCDPSQIQQVLLNLIINAAEAVQNREDARITVRTAYDSAEREIRLEVEDNGEGITPEVLGRIFDPFFTTKEEGKGVGLGLAVVYGIIQAHRGDIDVRTAPGAGTTFLIRLPLEAPEDIGVSMEEQTGAHA